MLQLGQTIIITLSGLAHLPTRLKKKGKYQIFEENYIKKSLKSIDPFTKAFFTFIYSNQTNNKNFSQFLYRPLIWCGLQ